MKLKPSIIITGVLVWILNLILLVARVKLLHAVLSWFILFTGIAGFVLLIISNEEES